MKRHAMNPRQNWQATVESQGFTFHTLDGKPYWDESVVWEFTLDEIENKFEEAANAVEELALAFVNRAVNDPSIMTKLGLTLEMQKAACASWRRADRNLYGRFDFAYDGIGMPKLLEYNADTPTSLLEAACIQWFWLEDQIQNGVLTPDCDQFNSIHERLVEAFGNLSPGRSYDTIHFACASDSEEDRGTIEYLAECARQAHKRALTLTMDEIASSDVYMPNGENRTVFVGRESESIDVLFKLYPWEWMMQEENMAYVNTSLTQIIEPAWKIILSNKGALPYLWQMAQEKEYEAAKPFLLESYFHDERPLTMADYVTKPFFSREGANVTITKESLTAGVQGPYSDEPVVVQELAPMAKIDGGHAVFGVWMVASQPAGMGIREDTGWITTNTARFVPHYIKD